MDDIARSLYDEDFYAWTQEQAELLRRGGAGANGLDIEHIAEEIEDLGKSEMHSCQSLCEHIIEHLLKLEYSGLAEPANHWRREIVECRLQLGRKLTRTLLTQMNLDERYRYALRLLRYLEPEMPGLMAQVPTECPYSLNQILGPDGEDWFPEPR
jgi:hypothetical protein